MKKIVVTTAVFLSLATIFFFFVPAFQGQLSYASSIKIGSFVFRLYGLILALSILAGYLVVRINSWRFGIDKEEVDNLVFWLVLIGIIGARVYYVIFDYNFFVSNPDEIYKIWHGGMSIFGSIIAGLVFIVVWTRKKAYSQYQLLDLAALGLTISQALGRFGNFFNQEAFGYPTDLPWKMYIEPKFRPREFQESNFFHPAFLYEAVAMIAVFFILRKLLGKVPSGVLAFSYLAMYSFVRFFVEAIRVDSNYIQGFKADQLTAFALMAISFVVIFWRLRHIEPVRNK